MRRSSWDHKPLYYVIVTRRDGSEFILETHPGEQAALERAAMLARCLEDCAGVRVSMEPASKTHHGTML